MGTKEYHAQKSRECYERNKQDPEWVQQRISRNNQRRRANKGKAVELFGGECKHCKGKFPLSVFEFHHLNPDEKETTPAFLFLRSWENIEKELRKCIMLCANCHRIEHDRLAYLKNRENK